jgi:ABC-type uncharacterized transport system fused permease/ATPase subunit
MRYVAIISQPLTFEPPTSWWQWILLVLAVLLGVFIVRLTVTLDLNSFLKDRRQRGTTQLQNACTHLLIENLGEGTLRVTNCFFSPSGTTAFYCSRCQVVSYNPERDYAGREEYYTKHIDEYLKAEKQFGRLLKKYGHIA